MLNARLEFLRGGDVSVGNPRGKELSNAESDRRYGRLLIGQFLHILDFHYSFSYFPLWGSWKTEIIVIIHSPQIDFILAIPGVFYDIKQEAAPNASTMQSREKGP